MPVRKKAVKYVQDTYGFSERQACTLADVSRSAIRYVLKTDKDVQLRLRMRELAEHHRRYGTPRLHVLLKREGLVVNHKRTERVYLEEKLSLRLKVRKKRPSYLGVTPQEPSHGDEHWSMDFISDSLLDGRRIRILTMMDLWDRSSPAIEIDFLCQASVLCAPWKACD